MHKVAKRLELRRTDSRYLEEVVDVAERAFSVTMLDDRCSKARADARKRLKLSSACSREIDQTSGFPLCDPSGGRRRTDHYLGRHFPDRRDPDPLTVGDLLGQVDPTPIGVIGQPACGFDRIDNSAPGYDIMDAGPSNCSVNVNDQNLWPGGGG